MKIKELFHVTNNEVSRIYKRGCGHKVDKYQKKKENEESACELLISVGFGQVIPRHGSA